MKLGWTTFPSPLTPIVDNPDFPPGQASAVFHHWREKGCKRVESLFDVEGIIAFAQLRRDYDLTPADAYPYRQLYHWVTQSPNLSKMSRPMTSFEKWIITKKDDRIISELYRMLCYKHTDRRNSAQVKWETEVGRPLTNKEWEQIYFRAHHTARNAASAETAFKVLSYWYYTPARIHQWDKSKSELCWRGCGMTGTLSHLLWHCPKLQRYWAEVLDNVDKAFSTTLIIP